MTKSQYIVIGGTMVEFIKATDLEGGIKDPGTHLRECPYGDWLYGRDSIQEGLPIMFVYADDEEKMLRSSTIQEVNIEYCTNSNEIKYKITTRNTIYYFKENLFT